MTVIKNKDMSFIFYDESDVPVCSEDIEKYCKFHVSFLKEKLEFNSAKLYEEDFNGEFVRRKVIYNPSQGTVFYVTDLGRTSQWFYLDLFNKLLPFYWYATDMLDRISSIGYTNEGVISDTEIERQRNRYEHWNEEVEFIDSILTDLKVGIY